MCAYTVCAFFRRRFLGFKARNGACPFVKGGLVGIVQFLADFNGRAVVGSLDMDSSRSVCWRSSNHDRFPGSSGSLSVFFGRQPSPSRSHIFFSSPSRTLALLWTVSILSLLNSA
eukprot:COSAG04_NODE_2667_length_3762_cov_170.003822_4_plen_115_part_00